MCEVCAHLYRDRQYQSTIFNYIREKFLYLWKLWLNYIILNILPIFRNVFARTWENVNVFSLNPNICIYV